MTALDTLSTFLEQRIADAEADLGPEAIGWIGMDATNRARGRVSALREIEQKIAELDKADERMLRDYMARSDLWSEQWQNLRDQGYDDTELRRVSGDR